jgi:hypothetical protein
MKQTITFRTLSLLVLIILGGYAATAQEATSAKSFIKDYLSYYDSIQNFRYYDQRGVNVFETPKDNVTFQGLRVRFGAGFTQQFQGLKHENYINAGGASRVDSTANLLYPLGSGFNTAMANLNMDVQLADGIRLNLVTYLSSRHHNEAWVKGGYIQFDKLPFKGKFWSDLMDIVTIKIGHMEINYGDQHFRRSDGGQTLYNPFMENYIIDAFTTEIGGEVYARWNGLFGMIGLSNGEIKGDVKEGTPTATDPNAKKSPAIYLKGGYDKNLSEKLRVRVSGSYYKDNSSSNNTLFWGDRTGSNYFMVNEPAFFTDRATGSRKGGNPTDQAWSGRVNPGYTDRTQGIQLNGFAKWGGLEFFGTYETGQGRSAAETADREFTQLAGELIYRASVGGTENLWVGVRYNTVDATQRVGAISNPAANPARGFDVNIARTSIAAGWFLTKNVMLKGEYVIQKYNDYPTGVYATPYTAGKFSGYVLEAVVGF